MININKINPDIENNDSTCTLCIKNFYKKQDFLRLLHFSFSDLDLMLYCVLIGIFIINIETFLRIKDYGIDSKNWLLVQLYNVYYENNEISGIIMIKLIATILLVFMYRSLNLGLKTIVVLIIYYLLDNGYMFRSFIKTINNFF